MTETRAQGMEPLQGQLKVKNSEPLPPLVGTAQTILAPRNSAHQVTKAEISLAPAPLAIAVDTPTDWPAIFVPFILGAGVVYFTLVGQRQQILSTTANYRHEWIAQLRSACVDFAAAAGEIKLRIGVSSSFVQTQEFWILVNRLITAQSKILLMIDVSAGQKKQLGDGMKGVIDNMQEAEGDGFRIGLTNFRNNSRVVLDEAWRDMKRDLGHSRPWYSRVWSALKKSTA